jgi:hypothetical protein
MAPSWSVQEMTDAVSYAIATDVRTHNHRVVQWCLLAPAGKTGGRTGVTCAGSCPQSNAIAPGSPATAPSASLLQRDTQD